MIRSTSGSNKLSDLEPKLLLSCSSKFFSYASTILSCNWSIANSNILFANVQGMVKEAGMKVITPLILIICIHHIHISSQTLLHSILSAHLQL